MPWEPLAEKLSPHNIQTLQAILALFQEQNIEGSAFVIAEDLEWISAEEHEALFQKMTPAEQEKECFQEERFLGNIGVSNGFLGEEEVEEALQILRENPQKTTLWECLEQKNIVEPSDLQALIKARKALCKQTLKMTTIEDLALPEAPFPLQNSTEIFEEEDEDLSDLDEYEDLEATLSEMSLTFVLEEEDEILDLQVEEAHFVEGSKYKQFKEWRQKNYSKTLLKKLDS